MTPRSITRAQAQAAAAVALALSAAGCGGDDAGGSGLSGTIRADGSSTVAPFTTAAAEGFFRANRGVRITVGIAGTGGGFSRFCEGETDISNASRPIDEDEEALCRRNGIEFVEFPIVNDGLSVVVNPDNDWATCLTVDELRAIWEPGSEIESWSQVRDGFPDEELVLAGPGTDSGTFDFFTETVNGESGASRSDFTASEDDNVIVQAVSGNLGGMGYFGLSYLEENAGRVKAVAIENESGECVAPTAETVQDGSYNPLGRELFVYAKQSSFARPEVQAFIRYMLDHNLELARLALFVPLTAEQRARAEADLDAAIAAAGAG